MERLSDGYMWYSQGFYDEAIEEFTKALDYDDTLADAYYNRGLAYEKLGNIESAMKDFQQAIVHSEHEALTKEISEHIKALSGQSTDGAMVTPVI